MGHQVTYPGTLTNSNWSFTTSLRLFVRRCVLGTPLPLLPLLLHQCGDAPFGGIHLAAHIVCGVEKPDSRCTL